MDWLSEGGRMWSKRRIKPRIELCQSQRLHEFINHTNEYLLEPNYRAGILPMIGIQE